MDTVGFPSVSLCLCSLLMNTHPPPFSFFQLVDACRQVAIRLQCPGSHFHVRGSYFGAMGSLASDWAPQESPKIEELTFPTGQSIFSHHNFERVPEKKSLQVPHKCVFSLCHIKCIWFIIHLKLSTGVLMFLLPVSVLSL